MRHVKKRNLRLVGALAVAGGLVTAGTVVSGAFAGESPGTQAGSRPRVLKADLPSKEEWLRQVTAALEPAQEFLTERLRNDGEDVAIVLDIDNTSLGTDLDDKKPMKDTLNLARFAHDKGALVMFVTNRKESGREKTTAELEDAGFPVDGPDVEPDAVAVAPLERNRVDRERRPVDGGAVVERGVDVRSRVRRESHHLRRERNSRRPVLGAEAPVGGLGGRHLGREVRDLVLVELERRCRIREAVGEVVEPPPHQATSSRSARSVSSAR